MKAKVLTAALGMLLLAGSGIASANSDWKRDDRPSYRGHERGWHHDHKRNWRPHHSHRHYYAYPPHRYHGWKGGPAWYGPAWYGYGWKQDRFSDGVTIIFRGRLD